MSFARKSRTRKKKTRSKSMVSDKISDYLSLTDDFFYCVFFSGWTFTGKSLLEKAIKSTVPSAALGIVTC